ncbi:MAG: phage holin family protein [Planctomycetaceae bacterium]|nr:phage holin family protein [Planctomycetaceae bacterium]
MIREFENTTGDGAVQPAATADFRTESRLAGDRCPPERMDDHRSFADLLKNLRDETTTLVRQEVALAKTEMSEKAAKFGRNAGYMGVGGVLAHAGAIILLLGLSALLYAGLVEAGLSHMTSGWLAPLIVGAVVAIIGYALAQKAINAFKHETLVPEKTVKSLKENQQWLSNKATA